MMIVGTPLWYLVFVTTLGVCYGDTTNTLDGVVAVAGIINSIGNAIHSARGYHNSKDPNAYVPFELKPLASNADDPHRQSLLSLTERIAECDPQIHGVCCLFPTLCVKEATCTSSPPTLSLESLVGAVPKCFCPPGFIGDGRTRGTGCTNMDECSTGEARCKHLCHDASPGYVCSCHPGYKLARDGYSCEDENECTQNNHRCSHMCVNTEGSYKCKCPRGQQLLNDGLTCQKVNECTIMKEIVALGTSIPSGTMDICEYPELCQDDDEGYHCECPMGFKQDPERPTHCIDINECVEGTAVLDDSSGLLNAPLRVRAPCGSTLETQDTQQCENTIGGYICSCRAGFTNANGVFPYKETFSRTRLALNTFGPLALNSFYLRWQKIMQDLVCQDIDECATSNICEAQSSLVAPRDAVRGALSVTHYNDHRATCVNTFGAYRCECPPGYMYSIPTRECVDVNECVDPHRHTCSLSEGEVCVNTVGSYTCRCVDGYREHTSVASKDMRATSPPTLNTTRCVDIDECMEGTHQCSYHCENTLGSYTCTCPAGFQIDPQDPHRCVDIDECQLSACDPSTPCVNLPGTYLCACPPGYSLTDPSPTYSALEHILMPLSASHRELLLRLVSLNHNASTSLLLDASTRAAYEHALHQIRQQLSAAHHRCTDINECAVLQIPVCEANTMCANDPGSFHCTCAPGYRSPLDKQPEVSLEQRLPTTVHSTTISPTKPFFLTSLFSRNLAKRRLSLRNTTSLASILPTFRSRILTQEQPLSPHPMSSDLALSASESSFVHGVAMSRIDHLLNDIQLSTAQRRGFIIDQKLRIPLWALLSWKEHTHHTSLLDCEDIDECSEHQHGRGFPSTPLCPVSQPCCVNTLGSYACIPKKRFAFRWECVTVARGDRLIH